jgi:hypothetical protein
MFPNICFPISIILQNVCSHIESLRQTTDAWCTPCYDKPPRNPFSIVMYNLRYNIPSWRLYQRVFYFCQILSPLNKLKTISEGVLLLPNTVLLNKLNIISEVVHDNWKRRFWS